MQLTLSSKTICGIHMLMFFLFLQSTVGVSFDVHGLTFFVWSSTSFFFLRF